MNDEVLKSLQPGDVLNFSGGKKKFPYSFVDSMVVREQKKLFPNGNNDDYHTEIFFDNYTIFSVQPPYPIFHGINDLKDDVIVSVYRHKVMLEQDNTEHAKKLFVEELREMANKIVWQAELYDVGQLLDFLCGGIFGEAYKFMRIFDFGVKNIVCSVGVGVCYNHALKAFGKEMIFQKINEENINLDMIKGYYGYWSPQRIYPSCFANSKRCFDGEFELIAKG